MATPKLASLELRGADGGSLYVDVRTGARADEARPAVVICHGFKGFKDWGFFPSVAERLALAGFTAVTFNFSGSGVTPGSDVVDRLDRWFDQCLSDDLVDIQTVVAHCAAGGAPWIGLFGHSRGGALAVLQAARDRRVRALVTWAAVAGFNRYTREDVAEWRKAGQRDVVNARTGQVLPMGLRGLDDLEENASGSLDVLAAAGRVAVPWLIVHGTADESVSEQEAESLERASGAPRTERERIHGAGHTFGARHPWEGSTPELDDVVTRTTRFLGAVLG